MKAFVSSIIAFVIALHSTWGCCALHAHETIESTLHDPTACVDHEAIVGCGCHESEDESRAPGLKDEQPGSSCPGPCGGQCQAFLASNVGGGKSTTGPILLLESSLLQATFLVPAGCSTETVGVRGYVPMPRTLRVLYQLLQI